MFQRKFHYTPLNCPGISFLLGIGIGAEYPCGSVSASEQSEQPGINKRAQHRWVALATSEKIPFLALRYWYFLSSRYYDRLWIRGSSICPTSALLDVHSQNVHACEPRWLTSFSSFGENHLRAVWRMSLGLGVIPALVVFFWRLNMDEPERFKKDSMRDTKIPYLLVIKRYWVSLLAISFTWCVIWKMIHQSLRAPAENAYSGSCTISLCECACRWKSHYERFSSSDLGGGE